MSINLKEVFDQYESEFLNFDRVPEDRKLSNRLDLCAFLLLDQLVPGTRDIVSAAEHDVIYLETDVEKLAEVATLDDVLTLARCGVMWNDEIECLEMFV